MATDSQEHGEKIAPDGRHAVAPVCLTSPVGERVFSDGDSSSGVRGAEAGSRLGRSTWRARLRRE
jgi:hypothetical protein